MTNRLYGWIALLLIGIATASMLATLTSLDIAFDDNARWYYAVLTVLGIFFMIAAFHLGVEPDAMKKGTSLAAKKRRR